MPRYGRTIPDDTRPPASQPVLWDDVATYHRGKSDSEFFAAMTRGPDYRGPRGQACNFQPVASKSDPRPKRFSEETAGSMREAVIDAKPRASVLGRAVSRKAGKPNAEDIYAWTHEPLFLLIGYDQTRLDRGRHIHHEHLVL